MIIRSKRFGTTYVNKNGISIFEGYKPFNFTFLWNTTRRKNISYTFTSLVVDIIINNYRHEKI